MTEVTKMEPQKHEVAQAADPMVSMIERIATDPNSDLDKLERMLAMKERLENDSRKQAFFTAMAECQAEMQPVARNKRNDQTSSNYADLKAIYEVCKPIAARHGLSFSTFPTASEKQGHIGVRWSVRHADGYEQSDIADIPLDDRGIKGTVNKTQTHAFGSTLSYARRYLFCTIFDVATGDDVDGNKPADTVTEEQYRELVDLIERTGTDEAKFKMAFGAKDPDAVQLTEFPASKFEQAKAMLSKKLEGGSK